MKNSIRFAIAAVLALSLPACYSLTGPGRIVRANSSIPAGTVADGGNTLEQDFREAAESAYGIRIPAPTVDQDRRAIIQHYLDSGFALVYARCNDFFFVMGRRQTVSHILRDLVAPITNILNAILALRNFGADSNEEQRWLRGINLFSSTSLAGLDVYDNRLLFGAENIDAVRELTQNALATHRAAARRQSIDTFQEATIQLIDHQAICTPPHILQMTRTAIRSAALETRYVGGIDARQEADQLAGIAVRLGLDTPLTREQAFGLWWVMTDPMTDKAKVDRYLAGLPAASAPQWDTGQSRWVFARQASIETLLRNLPAATLDAFQARREQEQQPLPAAVGGVTPAPAPITVETTAGRVAVTPSDQVTPR